MTLESANTNLNCVAEPRKSHHFQREQYRDYRMANHTGIILQMSENVEEVQTDRTNKEEHFPNEGRMTSQQRPERQKSVGKQSGETHRFIVTITDDKVTEIVSLAEDAERTNISDTNSAIRNHFENRNTQHLVQSSRQISSPRKTVAPSMEQDFTSDDYQEKKRCCRFQQVVAGRSAVLLPRQSVALPKAQDRYLVLE